MANNKILMAHESGSADIDNWLRNKNTLEFLTVWEKICNSAFNSLEFEGIEKLNPTLRADDDFVSMTFAQPAIMVRSKNEGTLERTLGKTQNLILRQLAVTPNTSTPVLAQHLDKLDHAIEQAIRWLCAEGKTRRIGPGKRRVQGGS